jgi:hypothetical protein
MFPDTHLKTNAQLLGSQTAVHVPSLVHEISKKKKSKDKKITMMQ